MPTGIYIRSNPRRVRVKRPIFVPIGPSIAIVPLTKGQEAIIDASDIPIVSGFNWNAWWNRHAKSFYATRSTWPNGKHGKSIQVFIHREILNAPKSQDVDHISGDTLNNIRYQMRLASSQENTWNQKVRSNNTSGAKGVNWMKSSRKWYAYITVNYKKINLGFFDDLSEAISKRQSAEVQFYGEFARIK